MTRRPLEEQRTAIHLTVEKVIRGIHFKPKYVVFIALAMAAMMFATAYIEIRQSEKETLEALSEEATSLIETIDHSAETTVLSNIEMENLIATNLLNSGTTIAERETEFGLTQRWLVKLASQNDIFHIDVYDGSGKLAESSHAPTTRHTLDTTLRRVLRPLLDGTADRQVLGLLEDPFGEGTQYLVAVKRRAKPGFILLELDSRYLLEFRKRIGIGRLIQQIANNKGIVYVVLQDERGILAASRNVSTMTRIGDDAFLQQAVQEDSTLSRITNVGVNDVFEVVKPFYVESGFYGLFRVGLSLDHVQALNRRTTQRFAILSLVVVVIGVIVFGFISSTQSYAVLSDEYRKMQTYTGSILDNMADAVVASDANGRITVFNKSAENLFHISADVVLGKKCSSVIADPQSCIERTLESGKPIDYEETMYSTNDGKTIVAGVGTSLVWNAKNEIDTVVAVIRDLSERRRVEEQLRRQEKLSAMGELAGSVAHEIRNPLNSISMTAQRFQKDFVPKEFAEEYFTLAKTMQAEAERVSTIITQFLRFARPPRLNPSEVNVSEFIRHLVSVVESEARAKNITLKLNVHWDGKARFDAAQMQQALLNIIQNGFHAMGKGGTLTLECTRADDDLVFRIADTGKGIAPEHLSKIFNLYFTTKSDGTGMGLSMAHQIVTEHGGRIEVNTAIGKGTTFVIFLPLRPENNPKANA